MNESIIVAMRSNATDGTEKSQVKDKNQSIATEEYHKQQQ